MSKRWAKSPRVFIVACAAGLAGAAQAQVNFIVPNDSPDGGVGTVGILRVTGIGAVNNQDDARSQLQSGLGTRLTASAPVINHVGDAGGSGHFGNDLDNINGDNKSYLFRGNIAIPTPGVYTFNVASDDGFTLAFNNGTVPFTKLYNQNLGNPGQIVSYNGNNNGALTFFGGRGTEDTGAQVNFPAAGTYHFDLTFHDGCCGDAVELSAAKGAHVGFNNYFHLVGGTDAPLGQPTQTRFAGIASGFQVATVHGNNANNLNDALTDLGAVLAGGTPASRGGGTPVVATATPTEIAYIDPQGANSGGHAPTGIYPGDTGADDNNFSAGAVGNLTIPAGRGGLYSFLVYGDDSSRLRILNAAGTAPITISGIAGGNAKTVDTNGDTIPDSLTDDGGCCQDIIGKWNLAEGNYKIELVTNEQGGGAGMFLFGATGDKNGFDGSFQLLGNNIDDVLTDAGSLALVAAPEPGTVGVLAIGAIAGLARRRRTA
jgi:hypothetical protein